MDPPKYSSATPANLPSARQMKRPSVAPASSVWRLVFPTLLFLAGVLVGSIGLSLVVVLENADRSTLVVSPAPQNAALVVQASAAYVNQIAQQKANSVGIPGTVKNVHITFVHNGPVAITGDDEMNLFGVSLTRHFLLDIQLSVAACKPTIHVLHANFGGIPITSVVASFEQNINQQLQQGGLSGLPPGFLYCITTIRTEPAGPIVTLSAQPVP